jgi:hypothetical protein
MEFPDGKNDGTDETNKQSRTINLFGRQITLPRSRAMRIGIGILLIIGGILGFLPVLGFWMIPLGFVVLSFENHHLRRLRRRIVVKTNKRAKKGS